MIRRFTFPILVAALLLIPVSAFAWRFASIADSRGNDRGVNTKVLTKIIERINAENVDLVIVQGDLVDSHSDSDLANKLGAWKSVMSKLKCPYYVSAGNHDIPTATSADVMRSNFHLPENGPKGYEELVYSFDHKNAHFVSVDSEVRGDAHRLQPAQLSWLRADLAGNQKPHVFVFTHDPAFPKGPHVGSSLDRHPKERDLFWRILSTHGCQMFFCGHEHLYARDEKDGVIQVLNGTCGAPPYKGPAGTVSKYHYVVVDVNGDKVHAYAKDENGKTFDSWSYSVTTDRPVQTPEQAAAPAAARD